MTVAEGLAGVRSLAIDTSALIDFVEEAPRSIAALRKIFARVDAGDLTLLGSSLLLMEIFPSYPIPGTKPIVEYEAAVERVTRFPVSEEIALNAAELRSLYGLASIDALHLATAIERSSDAFLTCDGNFLRAQGIPLGSGKTLRILKADRLT